ncbi:MAG TPA: protein kinase [Gemmatimonadaceae bacterium]|nr:protein kinase [Gemmatimonadaceae bacterium]
MSALDDVAGGGWGGGEGGSAAGSTFPEELEPLAGEYEYIREIGAGGMAAVYLAHERSADRLVAIKAIRRRYLGDEEAVLRFAREARVLADLQHPNIVETYAVRQLGERSLAIVMQHLSGGTLRQLLRREGQLSFERATAILRDVAEALRHAHAQGVVHRDVKPENIFLEDDTGRAVLSDFGIARPMVETEDENELTLVGAAIGTPAYMSPEQIDGLTLDGRTDIYSLGLVGWEMLSGRRPWEGENLYAIIYNQKHEELQRLTELRPDIPTPLLFAIEGALLKHRDTRWVDIDEFLAQLLESPQAEAPRRRVRLLRDAPIAPRDTTTPPGDMREWLYAPPVQSPGPREPAAQVFSQWGFAHPGEQGAPVLDDDEDMPPAPLRGAPRLRLPEPPPAWMVVAGALAVLLILIAVLAIDGTRRAPDGNAATLSRDSAETIVTTGALETDSVARAETTPASRERATSPRPEPAPPPSTSPPAARSNEASARPRLVARSHLDSLLLCDSPVQTHQRACLFAHISDNDTALNRVYREMISELRARGEAPAGQREPESVTRLRTEQREWLAWRDTECRRRSRESEGELWAPARAQCFAEFSAARVKELTGQLGRLRG